MSTSRNAKILEQACDGEHLAVWGLAGKAKPEIALSELLAERESRGRRIPVLTLLMRSREDAGWIEKATTWLSERGRRVIVRTRVVMPRSLVSILHENQRRGAGIVVELELAHYKPAIQRALLGAQADSASDLLLQSQHLATLEIPIVARLAPLMPGIHDQPHGFVPLLRNVEAADIDKVVLEVGNLHPEQVRNLIACQRELSVAGLLELARAYTLDPMMMLGSIEPPANGSVRKLKSRRAQVFRHALEQVVEDSRLRLPKCGCHAHCEQTRERASNSYARGYESVMGRDLFAGLELG